MLSPMTSQRPDSCQSSAGIQGGEEKFLRADGIHFGAHDLLDFEQRALREKQIAVDACGDLADVARAQQKLVARDLGLGGVFAQCGNEELAPEHNCRGRIQFNNDCEHESNRDGEFGEFDVYSAAGGLLASKTQDAAAAAKQYQLRGERS